MRLMICICLGTLQAAAQDIAPLRAAMDSISVQDLRNHIDFLASDSLEGREAGTRGGRAAGNYIVDQLRRFGVQAGGPNGEYFQPFGNGYRNILAIVPGSDPVLRNEYIVVGGHYDHVGYGKATNSFGPLGQIHNGADDNGSGTASVLEIAQAVVSSRVQLRRSVLFAFWDAEEKNLLGAKHFVRIPTVPLSQVKFAMNVDMVGRLQNNRLEILGTRTATGLRRFVSERNDQNLFLEFNWEIINDSDHWPFVLNRIPYLMPYTKKHPDYHRPSDDAPKIDFTGTQRITRLSLRLLDSLANARSLPTFRDRCRTESESTRRSLERLSPNSEPRFGVNTDESTGRVMVTSVVGGSPAAFAGVQPGDEIVKIDGYTTTPKTFRAAALIAASPSEVIVMRNGQQVPLSVAFKGSPQRIGLGWRLDAAEPGTAYVIRVVRGSVADIAGIKAGDRLISLDGKPIPSDDQFVNQLKTDPELRFGVDRAGQLSETVVRPLIRK